MHRSGDLVNKMERVTWREAGTVCQAIHLEPRSQSAVLRWEAAVQLSMNRTRINTNKVFRMEYVWLIYPLVVGFNYLRTTTEAACGPGCLLEAPRECVTLHLWKLIHIPGLHFRCPMIYDEPQESTSDHKKKDGHPAPNTSDLRK